MWFARTSNGFRGWFAIEVAGSLRGGLVPGDFVVTIITADDLANAVVAVTESTQLAGVYFFDVSSAFLIANGVGQYNVAVVTDTSLGGGSQPPVLDVYTEMMNVEQNDLDSLVGAGLSGPQELMLLELYRLAGLDPTKPLVVSPTTRKVPASGADISQTIQEVAGVVTVTRT